MCQYFRNEQSFILSSLHQNYIQKRVVILKKIHIALVVDIFVQNTVGMTKSNKLLNTPTKSL